MKYILMLLIASTVSAHELAVTLEITGVKINGGTVYIAVFDSAENFKQDNPCLQFRHESNADIISIETRLKEGFYRVAVFQDESGNGILDTGLFGIPQEPFGISNYKGRGKPGDFEKLKFFVSSGSTKISVNLGYYKA